jgi:tetraacyldisaccharide 4'-kinase
VGNLSVGGTGKTPLVAALARWLVAAGQRPAILSRGYARRVTTHDPLIVSDGQRVHADVSNAGDEPLMLARAVAGAAVVVSADRYAAGVVAERLGATIHLLDDGFQHLPLARDLDIVVTRAGALATDAVLPKGRLREPVAALARAHVLVVVGATDAAAEAEAHAYGVPIGLAASRRVAAPVAMHGPAPDRARPIVVMAGIGEPAQFVDALRADGWTVADAVLYRDHHWYTEEDLRAAARRVAAVDAWGLATTDKDAVRLERLGPPPVPVARWPLVVELPRWDVLTAAVGRLVGRAA